MRRLEAATHRLKEASETGEGTTSVVPIQLHMGCRL